MPTSPDTLYAEQVHHLIEQLHQLAEDHGLAVVVTVQCSPVREVAGQLYDDVATLAYCPTGFPLGPSMRVHLAAAQALEQCLEAGVVPTGALRLQTDMADAVLDAMKQGHVVVLGEGTLPGVNGPEGD